MVAEMFTPLCTVYADTSKVERVAQSGPNGLYYTQHFDVVFLCGMTELRAQIRWIEKVSTTTLVWTSSRVPCFAH